MKRILHLFPASLLVMFFLFVSVLIKPGSVHADSFAGGDGSQTNPYRIATCEQLQAMQDNTGNNYYILAGNVDCSGTTTWNGGLGFTPLTFSGHLDGRNHTIQNLYINDPASDERGLFLTVTNSVIKNIKMTGANITGRDFTGGMFDSVSNSQVSGVSFSGNVTGRVGVAGLAFMVNASTFSRCSASGTITSSSSAVVGLIEMVNNAVTISDCYVNADLVSANVAGLVGASLDGPTVIERSYVAGNMQDSASPTGFLGGTQTDAVWINNNLVVANMSAGSPAYFDSFNLDAPSQTGNYFDMKQTGAVDCGSSGYNNAECIGVSGEDGGGNPTYPFKNTSSVAPFTAWDFSTMWQVTADYPTLRDAPLDPLTSPNVQLSDTLTRIKVNTPSDHLLRFSSVNGLLAPTDTFVVTLGPDWDFGTLTLADLDLSINAASVDLAATAADSTWGVAIDAVNGVLTFTAPASGTGYINFLNPIELTISGEKITNPVTVKPYLLNVTLDSTAGRETYDFTIPIIDNDQVMITSFINTFINFDIDTGTTANVNCNYNDCQPYGGDGATKTADNYTVDLGELNSNWVNKSQDVLDLKHSDGGQGTINSIYFDLTTNAYGGAILTVKSTNSGLQGDGANIIASVPNAAPDTTTTITANSGRYGFDMSQVASGNGTIIKNSNCTDGTHYCALLSTGTEVLNTNGLPLDNGRAQMDLAAAAAAVNNPGTYQDTLTFIAVATY